MRRVLLAFEPPDGGVAENVVQLAAGLRDRGWEVELAGPQASPVYDRIDPAIRVHRLPFVRGYGSPHVDARAFTGLVRVLRAGRFDLVHCHSAKAGVLARLASRTTRTPVVYTPHCFPFVGDLRPARKVVAAAIERALAPLAAQIICVCEDEREEALRARVGRAARLRVVYNGCEPCDGAAPDPALRRLGEGGPVATAVAVLRRQKRIDVLVDAAPEVLRRVPDARIAIVGDGPLAGELRERARALGLADDPRFAFLPFEAPAARHLKASDLYVLPSSWEAMPIGVLEALACGVPQVATDVGGTSEAVTPETGLLVPPDDPAALAAAMAELLGDPERRAAMREASRARHARFGVGRMVAETAAVYDAVVPPTAPGAA